MFEWPGKELVLDFPEQEGNLNISMLGKDGDLDYSYKKGKLHIDLSSIYHNDVPCNYAWTIKVSGLKK